MSEFEQRGIIVLLFIGVLIIGVIMLFVNFEKHISKDPEIKKSQDHEDI